MGVTHGLLVRFCLLVAIGLPTVRIWIVRMWCHSWNPPTCLSSRFVPLTEASYTIAGQCSDTWNTSICMYIVRSIGGTSSSH